MWAWTDNIRPAARLPPRPGGRKLWRGGMRSRYKRAMRILALLVVLLSSALLPASSLAGVPAPGYTDTLVVGGLNTPTGSAFLPDGRLLVIEKGGAVK